MLFRSVIAPWRRATFSLAFLGVRGFSPVDGEATPDGLRGWIEERGPAFAGEDHALWWALTDGLGFIPGLPRPSSPPR